MIAITAYTEPIPAASTANEPQRIQEPEENEEHSSFEEILASLLRNSEISRTQDVLPSDFSDAQAGIDVNAVGNPEAENFFLFVEDLAGDMKDLSGVDFSDNGISEKYMDTLLSAEHLLVRSDKTQAADAENPADFPPEISETELTGNLAELEPQTDFFSLTETAETGSAMYADTAAGLAAARNAENVPLDTTNEKNERNMKDFTSSIPLSGSVNAEEIHSDRENAVSHNDLRDRQEEGRGRYDDLRSRSRRDRVTFEVRDLRTGTETNVNNTQTRAGTALESASGRVQGSSSAQEITMELRLPDYNSGSTGQNTAQTSWETRAGSALENMLARELHQNFNGDIVRHASMALRDGGEGTIRIALRPESLGNVKIRLEMTENRITGHIVVESEEALNAFRREVASLEQAFRDSGFTNADLNLSLAADGQSTEGREQEDSSFLSRADALLYEDSFGQETLSRIDVFFGQRTGSVNMLA